MSDSLCLYNSRVTGSLWINEKCLAKASSNVSRLSKTLNMSAHIYPYFVFFFDTLPRKSVKKLQIDFYGPSKNFNIRQWIKFITLCWNKSSFIHILNVSEESYFLSFWNEIHKEISFQDIYQLLEAHARFARIFRRYNFLHFFLSTFFWWFFWRSVQNLKLQK